MKFESCRFLVPGAENELLQIWLKLFEKFDAKNRSVEVKNTDTIMITCSSMDGIYKAYLIDSYNEELTIRPCLEWCFPAVQNVSSYFDTIIDSGEGHFDEKHQSYLQLSIVALHKIWLEFILRRSLAKPRAQTQLRKLMTNRNDFAIVSADNDSDGLGSPLAIIWKSHDCRRFVLNPKTGYYRRATSNKRSRK